MTAAWADVRAYWDAYRRRSQRAQASSESLTSLTRDAWVIPLLEALGYRLVFQRRAVAVDGRTYPISHRAPAQDDEENAPPVHIVGSDMELGTRPPSGRGTMSPHALLQD